MKISLRAINIICIVTEVIFLVLSILEIYSVAEALNTFKNMPLTSGSYCAFIYDIALPLSILLLTITIHILLLLNYKKEGK